MECTTFNNVYLEPNSNLNISNHMKDSVVSITINALGSCDLYGNINFDGYDVTFEINCSNNIHLGGTISAPNGNIYLSTSSDTLTGTEKILGQGVSFGANESIFIADDFIISGAQTIGGSIDFDDAFINFTITDNPTFIDGGTVIFDPCNTGN